MDRNIPTFSTAGLRDNLEWAYINKHLKWYIKPVPSRMPMVVGRNGVNLLGAQPIGIPAPNICGSPFGGWTGLFNISYKNVLWPFTNGYSFHSWDTKDTTIACLLRVGSSITNEIWRKAWKFRIGYDPISGYFDLHLDYHQTAIRARTYIGWITTTLLLDDTSDVRERWFAIALSTRWQEINRQWELFVADAGVALNNSYFNSAVKLASGFNNLGDSTDAIWFGTDETDDLKAPDHEIGCFLVTGTAWTEMQFLKWATNPMAWARYESDRSNIPVGTGCVHALSEVIEKVYGGAEAIEMVGSDSDVIEVVKSSSDVTIPVEALSEVTETVYSSSDVCEEGR